MVKIWFITIVLINFLFLLHGYCNFGALNYHCALTGCQISREDSIKNVLKVF